MINFANVKEWKIPYNGSLVDVLQVKDSNNTRVIWEKSTPGPDYTEPFYVENITNSTETVIIKKRSTVSSYSPSNAPTLTIEYSTDKSNWSTKGDTSNELSFTLNAGSKIYLRCNTSKWSYTISTISPSAGSLGAANYCWNSITGCSKIGGNILSLIYGNEFDGTQTTLKSTWSFVQIFSEATDSTYNTDLVDASKLILPANPRSYGYAYMFYRCYSLTAAPALPATTLAQNCYLQMFRHCESLVTSPALPAQSVASSSYEAMFASCYNLQNVGEISATTLNSYSMHAMFADCTSLMDAPDLINLTTLADLCCCNMFGHCTSLVSPPTLSATTLATACYYNMFYGCTSLTFTPVLPASTLVGNCYYQMFYGCSLLNDVKCYATTITGTTNWLYGVANSGTFTKASGATWSSDTSGIPPGWTVVDA